MDPLLNVPDIRLTTLHDEPEEDVALSNYRDGEFDKLLARYVDCRVG